MSEENNTKVRQRKSRTGVVVSDRMEKTIVVQIDTRVMHPVYKKYVRKRVKYKAHDETNNAKSDADNTLAANTVAQLTTRFSTTEVESWRDGLQSSGAVTHSLDPGSAVAFDQLDIGGLHNGTGDDAGKLLYMLAVQGGRNATVEAEIAARFPIGEVLP